MDGDRFSSSIVHGQLSMARSARCQAPLVFGGAIEEPFDLAAQRQLLGQLTGLIEILAETRRLGNVVVPQTGLDRELRIFVGQCPQPFFDLAPAVAVSAAPFELSDQIIDHAAKEIQTSVSWLRSRRRTGGVVSGLAFGHRDLPHCNAHLIAPRALAEEQARAPLNRLENRTSRNPCLDGVSALAGPP